MSSSEIVTDTRHNMNESRGSSARLCTKFSHFTKKFTQKIGCGNHCHGLFV